MRMDAEGGGGDHRDVHRERRIAGRTLALVLAVQNALVAACLLVTLYVFWIVQNQEPASVENVHIKFGSISSVLGNETLQFDHVDSEHMMGLVDPKRFYVNCTGPYVLYVDLCYKSLNNGSDGTLQLQVDGSRTPRSSFRLSAASREVCRGLQNVTFLRANEQPSLRLFSDKYFVMNKVTVGLSYMLGTGSQCFF